jgi:hypothetical protein
MFTFFSTVFLKELHHLFKINSSLFRNFMSHAKILFLQFSCLSMYPKISLLQFFCLFSLCICPGTLILKQMLLFYLLLLLAKSLKISFSFFLKLLYKITHHDKIMSFLPCDLNGVHFLLIPKVLL